MTKLATIKPFIIHHRYWNSINISAAEEHFGAVYMGPWCIKDGNGNWTDVPLEIFYNPAPNIEAGHTHYFGLFERDGHAIITDGSSAFSQDIVGAMGRDNEVVISRYAHDFRQRGSFFIDGGRDYTRIGGHPGQDFHTVQVRVEGADFWISLNDQEYLCSTITYNEKQQKIT